MTHCFLALSLAGQRHAQIVMGFGILRLQPQRFDLMRDGLRELALL